MWRWILSPNGLLIVVPLLGLIYLQAVKADALVHPWMSVTAAFALVPIAIMLHKFVSDDEERPSRLTLTLTVIYLSAALNTWLANQPGLEWAPLIITLGYMLFAVHSLLAVRRGYGDDDDDGGGGGDDDDPEPEPVEPPRERTSA